MRIVESYLELFEDDNIETKVYDYGSQYLININGELYFMRQLNHTNNSKVDVTDLGLAQVFQFSVDTLELNSNQIINVNKTQHKTGEERKKLPDCILKEIVNRIKGVELAQHIQRALR